MATDKPVKVQTTRALTEPRDEGAYAPLVDIYETDKELVVVAEVPGAAPGDVTVQVDKGVLTIEAESKVEVPGEDFARTYVGFEPGRYFRAFALSDEIDRDKIAASVSNGVVTVRLPKAPSARRRQIRINVQD